MGYRFKPHITKEPYDPAQEAPSKNFSTLHGLYFYPIKITLPNGGSKILIDRHEGLDCH